MNHLKEKTIERYLLKPESISASEQADIALHLSECSGCKQLYEKLKAFHQQLEETAAPPASDIDQFMGMLYPNTNILQMRPVSDQQLQTISPFVLAAKSKNNKHSRFERLITFGAGDYSYMVRVLKDHSANKLLIYVIPDDNSRAGPYIVRLPGLNRELITNKTGKAELSADSRILNSIEQESVELHLPLEHFIIRSKGNDNLISSPTDETSADYTLQLHKQSQNCRIKVNAVTENISLPTRMLVERHHDLPVLISLNSGQAELDNSCFSDLPITISLFE